MLRWTVSFCPLLNWRQLLYTEHLAYLPVCGKHYLLSPADEPERREVKLYERVRPGQG